MKIPVTIEYSMFFPKWDISLLMEVKKLGMRVMDNGERIRVPLGHTGKLWEIVRERQARRAAFHGVSKSRPGLGHKTHRGCEAGLQLVTEIMAL